MDKQTGWTIAIIAIIILFVFYIKKDNPDGVLEETAKCIGESSIVYSQIACHACETQKQLFGDSYQFLTEFVCNSDWNYCLEKGIKATPTWDIKGQKYEGVQSIEKLKELTGC